MYNSTPPNNSFHYICQVLRNTLKRGRLWDNASLITVQTGPLTSLRWYFIRMRCKQTVSLISCHHNILLCLSGKHCALASQRMSCNTYCLMCSQLILVFYYIVLKVPWITLSLKCTFAYCNLFRFSKTSLWNIIIVIIVSYSIYILIETVNIMMETTAQVTIAFKGKKREIILFDHFYKNLEWNEKCFFFCKVGTCKSPFYF